MSSTATQQQPRAISRARTEVNARERLVAGVVTGLFAGVVFALLSMLYAGLAGPGAWAPPRMIATILGFEMAPAFALVPVIAGLALHMMLSAAYGAFFALVAGPLPGWPLVAAGIVFGLALYIINFHVIAQLAHFAVFRMMAGNWFEIAVHALFGLLLAAGYGWWRDKPLRSA